MDMSLKEQRNYKDPSRLVNAYKKHGHFDETRKELFEEFKSSKQFQILKEDLQKFVSSTVEKDPNILNKNRGQMAALLQSQFFNKNSSLRIENFLDEKFKDKGVNNEFLKKLTKDLNHEFMSTYIEANKQN